MAISGEVLAAGGEIAAVTMAFWVCVGTASHQGQGRQRPKWSLDVRVGLDMEVGSWQVAQL